MRQNECDKIGLEGGIELQLQSNMGWLAIKHSLALKKYHTQMKKNPENCRACHEKTSSSNKIKYSKAEFHLLTILSNN